ncbi:MAG: hypothetical protein WCF54_19275 [Terracidiphilus sp.]
MHTHKPHDPDQIDVSLGYEKSDARVSGVVTFLIVLGVVGAVIGGIAYGMGGWLNARMSREDGPKNRWAQPVDVRQLGDMASNADMEKSIGNSTQIFPTPRVQTDDGNQDVADLHAREDLLLDNYSWADQGQGKVRIPIDRAMELVAQRGLPVAKHSNQSSLMIGDERLSVTVPLTSGFARTGYEMDRTSMMMRKER